MKAPGIYDTVQTETGHIIVAGVNAKPMIELLKSDGVELKKLITRRR